MSRLVVEQRPGRRRVALTAALDATVELGGGVRATAQLAQAFGSEATFGPQVTAGLAIDLGG